MSSNTGMAGLAVTAVVSALVAFGVATLLAPPAAPAPAAASPGAPDSADSLRREIDRLRREVEELRARRAPAVVRGTVPPDAVPSDEAPAPATREELRTFVDERLAERIAGGLVPQAPAAAAPVIVRRTLDEAGAELGLSSVDIDSVKRVWRESELEAMGLVMGTPDLDAVREEVKAAKEDPEKKAALINKVVGNFVRNLGKIATIEDRRNRELRKFMTEEQLKKLKGMNVKPTFENDEIEGIMKGTFGD